MENNMPVIFGLSNSKQVAEKIAKILKTEVADVKKTVFADGEILLQPQVPVRGKDTYVVQSTSKPVNDSIMELLIMIDALKRASAKSIDVVIPYFGYARQDRKAKGREPITSKLVAKMLETAGATRIITFDLHSPQLQGFFDIPCDDLTAIPTLAEHILKKDLKDIVVVSPDHGGAQRARNLANLLGEDIPVAIVDKRRTGANKSEIMNLIGEVDGKNAIMIDDMIDTGGTIVKGAEAVKANGAKSVIVMCTHPVLSGPAVERLSGSEAVSQVIVSDSIELPAEKQFDKLEVVTISTFTAEVIEAITNKTSVSLVYKKHSRDKFTGL